MYIHYIIICTCTYTFPSFSPSVLLTLCLTRFPSLSNSFSPYLSLFFQLLSSMSLQSYKVYPPPSLPVPHFLSLSLEFLKSQPSPQSPTPTLSFSLSVIPPRHGTKIFWVTSSSLTPPFSFLLPLSLSRILPHHLTQLFQIPPFRFVFTYIFITFPPYSLPLFSKF